MVCRPPPSRTYVRVRALRASWIEASVTKVARVSAGFSKSWRDASFGRPGEGALDYPAALQDARPFMSSLRLTISMRRRGALPPHVNLPRVVAGIGPINSSHGKRGRILWRTSRAPSRSWIAAEWTMTRIGRPSLSTGLGSCSLSPSCRGRNLSGYLCRPFFRRFDRLTSRTAAEGLASHQTSRTKPCATRPTSLRPSRWSLRQMS
jgi:hypothetical protein